MAGNNGAVSNTLPSTVKAAVNEPPICELLKVVPRAQVIRHVEFELVKMSALISVGGNLNDAQVQFIATNLVDFFPGESLADFKICFQRGVMGQYGDIYRMDGIVLRKWMEQYLDEKYQVVEAEMMKEKEDMYKAPENEKGYDPDKHQQWLNKLQEAVGVGKKVPMISRDEIVKNGQSEPVKKSYTSGYTYFDVRGVKIFASTQEHAEELAQKMVDHGYLIEVSESDEPNPSTP